MRPAHRPDTRTPDLSVVLALAWAALGTACVGGAESVAGAAPMAVAMPLGSRQCEAGGETPASLARRLQEAGVAVGAVGCGHDGRMRPAVCGAPDGQLAVLEIDGAGLTQARAQGFRPLSEWPGASRRPCRLMKP